MNDLTTLRAGNEGQDALDARLQEGGIAACLRLNAKLLREKAALAAELVSVTEAVLDAHDAALTRKYNEEVKAHAASRAALARERGRFDWAVIHRHSAALHHIVDVLVSQCRDQVPDRWREAIDEAMKRL